jgi:hypothetical protein
MDIQTSIIAVVLVAICALPFIITGRQRRKKENILFESLMAFTEKHKSKITRYDIENDFIIGVDDVSQKVFFIKKTKNKDYFEHLELSKISSCKVINTGKTVKSTEGSYRIIEKLELCFYDSVTQQPVVVFEFYSSDYDNLTLSRELILVEKWEKLLNKNIKQLTEYLQAKK